MMIIVIIIIIIIIIVIKIDHIKIGEKDDFHKQTNFLNCVRIESSLTSIKMLISVSR